MKLLPSVRLFFAADAGGGAGAAAAAPAADPGAAPTAAEVTAELEAFEAPRIDILKGDPKPEEAKPEDPAAKKELEQKKPDPTKPVEKPPTEPPAKQLREELGRVRKELDAAQAQLKAHPRVKELEGSIAELQKERDALRVDVERTRKELDIRDPLANGKLKEHESAFNADYARQIEVLPELDGQYEGLVREFAQLPRGDREAYRAKLGEFEAKVEDLVGQRKFGQAYDFIRKGYDYVGQREKMMKELSTDASRLAYEARESEWKQHDAEVSGALEKALEVAPDLETADPFAPLVYITKALGQLDEGKRTQLQSTVDTFTRRIFAGAKPRSDKDFPGLQPDEIKEKLAADGKWHAQARPLAIGMMKQGMLAMALMRPLVAELSRLRERVAKEGEAIPPDPTHQGGGRGAGEEDDIANYKAPAIRI